MERDAIKTDHEDEAFYSDSITVIHSPKKFIIDFKQSTPRVDIKRGVEQQTIVTKHKPIIIDVEFAKIFMKTLERSIKKYEEQFGEIKLPKQKKGKIKEPVSTQSLSYIG